jgi:GT2 family glycosyltransferase
VIVNVQEEKIDVTVWGGVLGMPLESKERDSSETRTKEATGTPARSNGPTLTEEARLGVCILFHERLNQTIDCIRSLLPSRVRTYILNNGSSEHAREELGRFCSKYRQIEIFDSKDNLGCGPGRNYLIDHTHEEWLLFLDNDIVVKTPEWLDRFQSHVLADHDAEVFVPRLFDSDKNRWTTPVSLKIRRGKVNYSGVIGDALNAFPGGASFVRRKLFRRLGSYDEKLFIGLCDFELALRGILSGRPVDARLVWDIELVHRHEPAENEADRRAASVRYDDRLLGRSFDRIVEKHGIAFPNDWREWAATRRRLILPERS